jgi:TRAP-type C4-dicarboxylate transport system permease small subunit
MNQIGRVFAAIESALGRLAGFLLIALLALINVEVVARYVFSTSTLIADEYGGYLMAWVTMLGAVHILRADRHLTMTVFVDRLSAAGAEHRRHRGCAHRARGVPCPARRDCGARCQQRPIRLTIAAALATPLAWAQLIVPTGYALLCLAYLEEILRRFRGLPPRREAEDIDVSLS